SDGRGALADQSAGRQRRRRRRDHSGRRRYRKCNCRCAAAIWRRTARSAAFPGEAVGIDATSAGSGIEVSVPIPRELRALMAEIGPQWGRATSANVKRMVEEFTRVHERVAKTGVCET